MKSLSLTVAMSMVLGGVACSAPPPDKAEPTASVSQNIFKGIDSPESQNAALYYRNTAISPSDYCNAALIAPNLAITALHCVANFDNTTTDCLAGEPGATVFSTTDPATSLIFVGNQRPTLKSTPATKGKKILNPPSADLCLGDVALIILEDDLVDVTPLPIRLDNSTAVGEAFTVIGWGQADTSALNKTRQQKPDMIIRALGPGTYTNQIQGITYPVSEVDFVADDGICYGDSGSPAVANQSGALIGVFSAIAQHAQVPAGKPKAYACIDASTYYIKTAAFKDFILDGFKQAGHAPWLEGTPRPGPFAQACKQDSECDSSLCVTGKCSRTCDTNPCPTGFDCVDSAGGKVCQDPSAVIVPDMDAGAGGNSDGDAAADASTGDASIAPPKKQLGDTCSQASDCDSQLCAISGTSSLCTVSCADQACPTGWNCIALATPICAKNETPASDSSCSLAAPAAAPPPGQAVLGLLVLAAFGGLVRRNRRP